jgi:hypothetical protein
MKETSVLVKRWLFYLQNKKDHKKNESKCTEVSFSSVCACMYVYVCVSV